MGSDGTWELLLSMWSHFSSFLSLCLSGVTIVACVLYWRKYKDLAGVLMLASELVGIARWIVGLLLVRLGMVTFTDFDSWAFLGWMGSACVDVTLFAVGFWFLIRFVTKGTRDIACFRRRWPVLVFFGTLFVTGSWFVIVLVIGGTRDIDYFQYLWPVWAVFSLIGCLDLVVMVAACVLYLRKNKDTAGYLLFAGTLVSIVTGIASMGMTSFVSLDWMKFVETLFGLVAMVGECLFTAGFWMLIKSLIAGTQEEIAHGF